MNARRLCLTLLILLTLLWHAASAQAQTSEALLLTLDGPLNPAMLQYLERGLERAAQGNVEVVILQLNTPGGSIDLMTAIVQAIRASETPVVVYVSPRGAIAASAGTVITLAGHVAAMAPETAIGAASPVGSGGEDIGETLEAKVKETIKAQIRSLTEGRSPEAVALAEDTVENAKAVSAREAFEIGLVDILADDVPDLLRQLDGRVVRTSAGERALNTEFLEVVPFNPTPLEELLGILTNPNIVFILLTIGVQAILIELGSPGGWVAGLTGVASLALAAYGLGVLPVNWFGLVFLITSFVLFFLDVKAPTHGALTAAGIVTFVVGALVLFNTGGAPEFAQVSVPLVIATALVTAISFGIILGFAIRAQATPARMGQESLLGQQGVVRLAIPQHGQGEVQLSGERWTAELADGESPLDVDTRVEVVGVQGVRVIVRKVSK